MPRPAPIGRRAEADNPQGPLFSRLSAPLLPLRCQPVVSFVSDAYPCRVGFGVWTAAQPVADMFVEQANVNRLNALPVVVRWETLRDITAVVGFSGANDGRQRRHGVRMPSRCRVSSAYPVRLITAERDMLLLILQ